MRAAHSNEAKEGEEKRLDFLAEAAEEAEAAQSQSALPTNAQEMTLVAQGS